MNKPLSLESKRILKIKYNLPISRTSKFWKELKNGSIYTTKCKQCKRINFPPVADCGICGSSEVEWIELSGDGNVVTFTKIFAKPASFSDENPYIVVIVKLKEGVKVLAWLTGVKIEDVKFGLKVRLIPKVTGDRQVSYEFVQV
ncbi:Zn-ribbon domain-containing OB-fold protein [Candidatus Bathyarchaeota archaeon]|nr:Zn-ribbon domain-containing OB-fold protein [Candidatus Bathyarchaeota archaeon]